MITIPLLWNHLRDHSNPFSMDESNFKKPFRLNKDEVNCYIRLHQPRLKMGFAFKLITLQFFVDGRYQYYY